MVRPASFLPFLLPALLTAVPVAAQAHGGGQDDPPVRGAAARVPARAVAVAPVIDGRLDDAIWLERAPVTDFWKMRPVDDQPADERTEAWVAYDRRRLYVAIRAHEAHAGTVRGSLANRDDIFADDVVGVLLDTFHDRRRGYLLFVNPLGVQADGVAALGQDDDMSIDLVWESAARRDSGGSSVEIAIPFRSLRFPSTEVQTWGFAVVRMVKHSSVQEVYPRVDVDDNCLFCQFAELTEISNVRPGRTFELLPTLTASQQAARPDGSVPFSNGAMDVEAGLGLKYGITSNLTADVTVNPDFSQVESDVGQIEVNQRFAIYYPEKRPFFLEGQEIFQTALQEATPVRLVHTRNIYDPGAAAKMTGKIGGTMVGALVAMDQSPVLPVGETVPTDSVPADQAWFGILRLRQDVGHSSAVGLIATSREFADSYNRVAGADGQFGFLGRYTLRAQGVWSETRGLDGVTRSDAAVGANLEYASERLRWLAFFNDIGPDFRTDAGFTWRTNMREGGLWIGLPQRPNGRVVLSLTPQFMYRRVYDHAGVIQDEVFNPRLSMRLARETFVFLNGRTGLERYGDVAFHKTRVGGEVSTSPWKVWSGGVGYWTGDEIDYGAEQPYLGFNRELNAFTTIRPNDALAVELSLAKSTFWVEPGGAEVFDVDIWRAKATYQFSRELFVRLIGEWNTYDGALAASALVSYVAGPGTVFFLGADSGMESPGGGPLTPTRRAVFAKASYLLRL
jgi:hypothetical protein